MRVLRRLRPLLPDSLFGRLFGMVVVAVLASHLVTTLLFLLVIDDRHFAPPPPPRMAPLAPTPDGTLPLPRPRHDGPRLPPPLGLWLGLATQIAALTLAAWYGARLLARPIQQLADAAERLGDNLNSPPIDERGPREARLAARVFNRMQDRIRAQLEERDRFLAAVSHDLRTPLTRMKLRVETLAASGEGEAHRRLREDIGEMAAMLDATLNYLRGEAHSEAWQRLDIQALVDSVAEDAREKGGEVAVSGSAQAIEGLPHALRRCLDNLVDNAVRYGERATITLCDSPTALLIEIRDAGPGIPENRLAQVMEPFVRLEPSRNRDSGGVGLGLSIARDTARRNGGELSLRNAPSGGLVARLTLPRREA